MASTTSLAKRADKARATTMQRHVLVCADGDCGGKAVARCMGKEVARAGLRTRVTVTRVDCLNICKGGTVAVVYPEGTWYGNVDKDGARRIVRDHLADGDVVEDLAFLHNDLRG